MMTPRREGRKACATIATIAVSLLAAACASTSSSGARPRPFPTPERRAGATTGTPPSAPLPGTPLPQAALPATEQTIVDTALGLRGTPYKNGGTDPNGFDCSGFTQYVFAKHGIVLPRETREQYEVGEKIGLKDVQVGDLVFFHTVAKGASHVGIALNDDEFVHAPSAAGVVRVEHLSSAYWSKRFLSARRVAPVELAARPLPAPFPGATRASRSAN